MIMVKKYHNHEEEPGNTNSYKTTNKATDQQDDYSTRKDTKIIKSGNFAIILFSRIALIDIFATLKIHN